MKTCRSNLNFVSSGLAISLFLGFGLGCSQDYTQSPLEEMDLVALVFAEKEGEPLVTVEGKTLISVEEFGKHLDSIPPQMRGQFSNIEAKSDLLDRVVKQEILAREAVRRNVHLQEDVQNVLKKALVNAIIGTRDQGEGSEEEITEERLREVYEENLSDFVQPERVRISHIFFQADPSSEVQWKAATDKARKKLEEIRNAERGEAARFSQIARSSSEDKVSSKIGGDLQYNSREQLSEDWGSKMTEAAFAIESVGTISDVVEGDKGIHILRLIGRQRAVDRKLDDVRPQLVNRVRREDRNRRFEEFVDGIAAQYDISVDKARLEALAE